MTKSTLASFLLVFALVSAGLLTIHSIHSLALYNQVFNLDFYHLLTALALASGFHIGRNPNELKTPQLIQRIFTIWLLILISQTVFQIFFLKLTDESILFNALALTVATGSAAIPIVLFFRRKANA